MNEYVVNELMHLHQWVDFNLLWNENLEYQLWAACKIKTDEKKKLAANECVY